MRILQEQVVHTALVSSLEQSPFKFALSTNHGIIAARFANLNEAVPAGLSSRTRQLPESSYERITEKNRRKASASRRNWNGLCWIALGC